MDEQVEAPARDVSVAQYVTLDSTRRVTRTIALDEHRRINGPVTFRDYFGDNKTRAADGPQRCPLGGEERVLRADLADVGGKADDLPPHEDHERG